MHVYTVRVRTSMRVTLNGEINKKSKCGNSLVFKNKTPNMCAQLYSGTTDKSTFVFKYYRKF